MLHRECSVRKKKKDLSAFWGAVQRVGVRTEEPNKEQVLKAAQQPRCHCGALMCFDRRNALGF